MKMAYFYYYANIGGVTSVIKSRLPALKRLGWSVDAFFEKDVGGVNELMQSGVDTVKVITNLKEHVVRLLRDQKFDAITVFDMPELIPVIREVFDGPVFYEIHTPIDRVLLRTDVASINAATRVFVPSVWSKHWVAEKIRGIEDTSKIIVVPNIIDREMFYHKPVAGKAKGKVLPKLVWVGKVAPYKRWRDALRVIGGVVPEVDCEVILVTGGEINEAGTADLLLEFEANVGFKNSRWCHNLPAAELADLYRECQASHGLVLSTSEAESFCLVVHEAFSCGAPVVAASAGALPEIFTGGLSSLLFEVGDIAAARKITIGMLKDTARWKKMSEECLAGQKNFDPVKLAEFYVEAVQEACGHGRKDVKTSIASSPLSGRAPGRSRRRKST